MQAAAVRWGFHADDIGLVTGNRRVNPDARILIVVAEILLNRLLHPEGFDFSKVSAVVMDEFHSFADPERGIVWELSLGMLHKHIRLLLLSATVGNAAEFLNWLDRCHGRKMELVEGTERKIPLTYHWVPESFLGEHLVDMAKGDESIRKTPALVFCFNRDECWSVAEMLKGLDVLPSANKSPLNALVDKLEWPHGVGPKLKQMLRRGVGVHHAGLLPRYRRVVEELFEEASQYRRLYRNSGRRHQSSCPFGRNDQLDERAIRQGKADRSQHRRHQIFGRAGRPQYDKEGHVFALAHEDDVRSCAGKNNTTRFRRTAKTR